MFVGACANGRAVDRLNDGTQIHTFRREWANAYLVVHAGEALLVDSGFERNANELARAIAEVGVDPARLKAVVVTHGHADHAGAAGWFQRQYGTRVIVGAGDEKLTEVGRESQLCPTDAMARSRVDADRAETYTPYQPDQLVVDETTVTLGETATVRVVRLAGHTAGSVVVVVGEAALVGDLFRGELFGSGAHVHFYMCDLADNRRDVEHLLEVVAPKATVFFPGHFTSVSRDAVKQTFQGAVP